jgi:hypothetical protein
LVLIFPSPGSDSSTDFSLSPPIIDSVFAEGDRTGSKQLFDLGLYPACFGSLFEGGCSLLGTLFG